MLLKQINGNVLNLSDIPGFDEFAARPENYVEFILKEINNNHYANFAKNGDIAIDAGANIGLVTLYLAPAYKKIHAIEPTPEYINLMKNALSCFQINNVLTYQYALAPRDEIVAMRSTQGNGTMNTFVKAGEVAFNATGMTLKTFMEQADIKSIDFMKMDLEGAEMEIIPEENFFLACSSIKSLYIEIHDLLSGTLRDTWKFTNIIMGHLIRYGFKVSIYAKDKLLAERVS